MLIHFQLTLLMMFSSTAYEVVGVILVLCEYEFRNDVGFKFRKLF